MPKINPKFAELVGKDVASSGSAATGARISKKSLRDITIVAEKAIALSGGNEAAGSTVGTICTSECISTASSVCFAQEAVAMADRDPELMRAVSVLHDRAIAELGEDGLADAMARLNK